MRCFIALLALAVVALGHPLNAIGDLPKDEIHNNTWVVLVAGSNGWSNYRHQADVCHAYQVVHNFGVPDEHIIVMMYDDLANAARNPDKGKLINEPDGPDVYTGVLHDYTGKDVTADNYIKIMTGIDPGVGSRKYLKSTKQDHVFMYFDDHGGPGEICFPVGAYLTRAKFGAMIDAMAEKGLYGKLILIVQACESGSMFYKLTLPPNVYGVSSAPVGASAFAFNYVNKLGTYVASRYAFAIWHNAETQGPKATWQDNFDGCWEYVMNYSQPCQYGDLSFTKIGVEDYFHGPEHVSTPSLVKHVAIPQPAEDDSVPQWDVPLEIARRNYLHQRTAENLAAYKAEMQIRADIDALVMHVLAQAAPAAIPRMNKVPCVKCDSSCPCYQYAEGSKAAKEFECCNEQSCFQDPPKSAFVDEVMDCGMALAQAFSRVCDARFGKNGYTTHAKDTLFRACRTRQVNVAAAIEAIHDQCSA